MSRESCEEYSFYEKFDSELDDDLCLHCSKYLTVFCPYIDEFMKGEEIENV